MKKYYTFGEIILTLREEYNNSKHLLEQLNNCINVEDKNVNFYFSGLLSDNDSINLNRKIRLIVEKKYLDILKKIQYIKYDWYSEFIYRALFEVEKKDNGLYGLYYVNIKTPFGKKYIPKVEIINQSEFSNLIDILLSSDLMKLKQGYFSNNHDKISLNFDEAYISTSLGDGSVITWNGINDNFEYRVTRHNSHALIEEIFSLEIPADKIAPDWLKLLEKYEDALDQEISFAVNKNVKSKEGILYISETQNNKMVKLLKK